MIHFAVNTFFHYCNWNTEYSSGDIGTYSNNLTEKHTEITNAPFNLKVWPTCRCAIMFAFTCKVHSVHYQLKNMQQNVHKQLYFKMKFVAAAYKLIYMLRKYIGCYFFVHSYIAKTY